MSYETKVRVSLSYYFSAVATADSPMHEILGNVGKCFGKCGTSTFQISFFEFYMLLDGFIRKTIANWNIQYRL